jgi:hypothetical protein
MWLLPPDFSADAFDVPPGTWALPWYADEQHVAALMRLLVAGETRIREWVPLPWAALDEVRADDSVRPGAALVLDAPEDLSTDEIVTRARELPWPYVFWRSSRPTLEGEGAWLERELKQVLSSEIHRGLLDPRHPLARYHVERLPLDLVASMVGDPVDFLEIAQAAVLHRLEHATDGLRREDYEHSVKWVSGKRLGDYLSRIRDEDRVLAVTMVRQGGRGEEDRGNFRRAALAVQGQGLGFLVGEDLALGPLARAAGDGIVWAGAVDRIPRSTITRPSRSASPHRSDQRKPSPLRITLPPAGILQESHRYKWIVELGHRDGSSPWHHVLGHLLIALQSPTKTSDFTRMRHLLSTSNPTEHRDQRIQDLFELFVSFADPSREARADLELATTRLRATALVALIARNDAERAALAHIDSLLVEHVLMYRPTRFALATLMNEALTRPVASPSQATWIDAVWASIGAEALRRSGRSHAALLQFDEASHRWASLDPIDFREEWLSSRVSAACAAFEADQIDYSAHILDLITSEVEEYVYARSHAMIPLLRGLIASRREANPAAARAPLELAAARYRDLHNKSGEMFATMTLHALGLASDGTDTAIDGIEIELERTHDDSGLTYANILLGNISLRDSGYELARMQYRKAEVLAGKTGDDLALSTVYHGLADLEAQRHRYQVALGIERQAQELETAIGHTGLSQQTERTIREFELLAASASAIDPPRSPS